MGGVRCSTVWAVVCLVVLGCQGPTLAESIDLGSEDGLYVPSGFRAQVPTDQAIVLLPFVDRREPQVEEASDPRYPTRWMDDSYWPRPMSTMMHDVVRLELTAAGLGSEIRVDPAPRDEDVLLSIDLLEARAGREEREFGRLSVARLKFRYTVTGPAAADGSRPKLYTDTVDQIVSSKISARPPTVTAVMAQAMRAGVGDLMRVLDEQNVTRSGLGAPDPLGVERSSPAGDGGSGNGGSGDGR